MEENDNVEKPTMSGDKALEDYIDKSLKIIDEVMDLLLKAEASYTMSKNAKSGDDWKARRDGFRAEGTDFLNKAKELLIC